MKLLLLELGFMIFLSTFANANCLPYDAFEMSNLTEVPSYKWGILSRVEDIKSCSDAEIKSLVFIRNTTPFPGAKDILEQALAEAQERGLE